MATIKSVIHETKKLLDISLNFSKSLLNKLMIRIFYSINYTWREVLR
ncbi:hypothetical protein D1BOALGB6SA_10692 [Olavius sp. associated proteobacterium Delta 1]|nr:hypothetical protein D1BOALGB6SA_10692 [Olavius sp. associated proteobacterium Delta 1]